MGRRYSVDGDQNAAASVSVLGITSAATVTPLLYYVCFGSAATPADQAFNMQLNRYTAAGTGGASPVPQRLDPSYPQPGTVTANENHSAEPTYTAGAVLLSFSVNQQATFQWQTIPNEGMMIPATAANGIGLRFVVVSGGTALCEATFMHDE